jgi:hypothetical protein
MYEVESKSSQDMIRDTELVAIPDTLDIYDRGL